MGHREDLLEGAKRCLLEKGYSRTTARDIVRESKTNLASIGYHYGSKDALLREALFAAMGDWADDMQRALEAEAKPAAPLAERVGTGWSTVTELFDKHQQLWAANLEVALRAKDDPELMAAFARAQPEAQRGLVSLFHGVPEDTVSDADEQLFGTLYHTLVAGLVLQKALDYPTLSGPGMVEAMRRIVGGDGSGTGGAEGDTAE